MLSFRYYGTALSTGFIPKLKILLEILKILNQRREKSYVFRKSNICSDKLDVLETNFSVSQSN